MEDHKQPRTLGILAIVATLIALFAFGTALAAHPGDVLELGCGDFSTPIIRAVAKAHHAVPVIMDAGWLLRTTRLN